MDSTQYQDLLSMLKVLADENRLRLISLMSEREWSVSELAEKLQLADSTMSYHLNKLHGLGLLKLRMDRNYRYYSLNPKRVVALKAYINEVDAPVIETEVIPSDDRWIDALDWDESDKKILRDYTENGKLIRVPSKEKKWLVILRWLASRFEPGVRYTEKEVNAILTEIHEDYATTRRDLVGYGFMRRERGGGDYWLTPENEPVP